MNVGVPRNIRPFPEREFDNHQPIPDRQVFPLNAISYSYFPYRDLLPAPAPAFVCFPS